MTLLYLKYPKTTSTSLKCGQYKAIALLWQTYNYLKQHVLIEQRATGYLSECSSKLNVNTFEACTFTNTVIRFPICLWIAANILISASWAHDHLITGMLT